MCIYAIWLPSWYPSIESPQNGDFIHRHALAVSRFARIRLVFNQSSSKVRAVFKSSNNINNRFKEDVLLFPRSGIFFFSVCKYFYFYDRHFKNLYRYSDMPAIIHVHVSFRAGLIALWLKIRYKVPYIITEHWTFFNNESESSYSNSNIFIKWVIKRIFENAAYVLPVSHDLATRLHDLFPFIETIVVPNVVEPTVFYLDDGNLCSDKFKFIHVSSLNALKRPSVIVRTFKKIRLNYSNAVLEVVGPAHTELLKEAAALDFPDGVLMFTGMKAHDEVASLMRRANAFVLFSTAENLPCVIAESLCCGVPVISSSVGGVPEMVDDSNGILVPPGDEEALYKAMESMILNYNKYNRQRISEDAQAKYNPEVVGRQIVEVYEKVLKKK